VLGLKSEMTKPEAKRRLLETISAEGINTPTYLERALGNARTFNEVADKWERMRLPKLSISSQYASPKLVEIATVLWKDGSRPHQDRNDQRMDFDRNEGFRAKDRSQHVQTVSSNRELALPPGRPAAAKMGTRSTAITR
jgi:hypothetical protein